MADFPRQFGYVRRCWSLVLGGRRHVAEEARGELVAPALEASSEARYSGIEIFGIGNADIEAAA